MKWQTLRMRGGGVHKQWRHHTQKYFTFLNYSKRHGAEKRSSSAKLLGEGRVSQDIYDLVMYQVHSTFTGRGVK